MKSRNVRLVIDSSYEKTPLAIGAVAKLCKEFYGDKIDAEEMKIAVAEAVNNAIEHAYQGQPGNDVEVLLEACPNKFVIAVVDRGKTMPKGILQEDKALDFDQRAVDELPEGGMGLALIKNVMDECSYVTEEGCNKIVLTKHLP